MFTSYYRCVDDSADRSSGGHTRRDGMVTRSVSFDAVTGNILHSLTQSNDNSIFSLILHTDTCPTKLDFEATERCPENGTSIVPGVQMIFDKAALQPTDFKVIYFMVYVYE